jgi:hypothetical protein
MHTNLLDHYNTNIQEMKKMVQTCIEQGGGEEFSFVPYFCLLSSFLSAKMYETLLTINNKSNISHS